MTHETDQGLDAPADAQALWVGAWKVCADVNQVARGGQVLRLEPKAMAVLMYLARRPQEVVSREDLLAAVWPGVVVGDNALTQVVIKLRKALGDTARDPAYVQAIAKKGYRLIADVRHGGPTGDVLRPAAPAQRVPHTRWAAGALTALLVLAVAVAGAAWLLRPAPAPAPRAELLQPQAPAVLVEPFEVLSAQPEPAAQARQLLLARAIGADLATDLSKVSGLWVLGGRPPAGQTPTEYPLHPRYVLSGTVQQQGDRLRLNVRLTDAEADRQIWSARFDRQVQNLFEVQDDLVKRILEVLPVKLSEAETLRVAQRSTRNLQAYESFVRAQAALQARRPAQIEAARALYWAAIGADPAFARAYAGLALSYALEYQQGWAGGGPQALARASEFAATAVRMRPDMPEAHWVLAFVRAQGGQHDAALRDLSDALQLNPSYSDAYALEAGIYTYVGKPAQSIALVQQALRLNPDAGSLYLLLLGRAYYFLGDNEQARFNLNHALERNPENLEARIYLAATLWRAGERDAAQWQVSEIHVLEPGFRARAWLAHYPLTDTRLRQQLQASMAELGLQEP